jgi:molecular chaperone GrpE
VNGPAKGAGTGAQSNSSGAPTPQASDESPESTLAELEDRLLRARADLDNLRKRHAAELGREREAERARVAATLLPVLDNLELALAHAEADPGAIVQGVLATRDQAVHTLAALGYPRDEETGVRFDPNRHEVVAVVEDSDTEPNTVTRVVRPGYGTAGHELRPGAVVVSRPRAD